MEKTEVKTTGLIFSELPFKDPQLLSPLALAYVGDAVYELAVRRYLVKCGVVNVNKLHHQAVEYVRAGAQAKVLLAIEEKLTEEEFAVVRRGRNAKSVHVPKGAGIMEYHHSTALECLVGYLYLKGCENRLNEIMQWVGEILDA